MTSQLDHAAADLAQLRDPYPFCERKLHDAGVFKGDAHRGEASYSFLRPLLAVGLETLVTGEDAHSCTVGHSGRRRRYR